MALLGELSNGLAGDMSSDPGYQQVASQLGSQLGGERPHGIARHMAGLHGQRDIVPQPVPTTLSDPSMVNRLAGRLDGEDLGAQNSEIMRNFASGNLDPGPKAEGPQNLKRISGANAAAIIASSEAAGATAGTTASQGDGSELNSFFEMQTLGPDIADADAMLENARAAAESR
jgi:hypothetical protein